MARQALMFGPFWHPIFGPFWVAGSKKPERQDLGLQISYISGQKKMKKKWKPTGAISPEFFFHFWAKSGKYRVFTVVKWLREHPPYGYVGHQLMPPDRFGTEYIVPRGPYPPMQTMRKTPYMQSPKTHAQKLGFWTHL
jgi:hypothetical protein